jgi:type II secretory pathway component PulM
MKELTKEQKKIISIAAIVLVFIVLFWSFVYLPQSRKLGAIKEELRNADAQIAEINRLTQGRDLTEVVTQLNKQLDKTDDILPAHEDTIVNFLSQSARSLGIDVKNMNVSERKVTDVYVAGRRVEELPVSMNIASDFKSIGEYLNILRDSSLVLVRVREIDIKGNGLGHPELNASLQITAYLLPEG